MDRVSAQTNRCPPKVLAAFSKGVERLEVDSIRVRARSQVMRARGDAYFENWHENLARVEDPRIRDLAERNRPELQRRFANIKRHSDNTRAVFKPFLAGLRTLQSTLENDPGAVATEPVRDLVRLTKERGRQVEQGIASVGEELRDMAQILNPARSASR